MNKYEKIDKEIKGYTQSEQPGIEKEMDPKPIAEDDNYKGSDKLKGKVALITGGDSGIGRAVAICYAKKVQMLLLVTITNIKTLKIQWHD